MTKKEFKNLIKHLLLLRETYITQREEIISKWKEWCKLADEENFDQIPQNCVVFDKVPMKKVVLPWDGTLAHSKTILNMIHTQLIEEDDEANASMRRWIEIDHNKDNITMHLSFYKTQLLNQRTVLQNLEHHFSTQVRDIIHAELEGYDYSFKTLVFQLTFEAGVDMSDELISIQNNSRIYSLNHNTIFTDE